MSESTNTQIPGAAAGSAAGSQPPAQQQENPNPGTGGQEEKTYTSEELLIRFQEQTQKVLAEEKVKWEKESETKIAEAVAAAQTEAAKMAKMTEDEKAKAEIEKQRADNEAKAKDLALKEIRMDAATALTAKSLPAEALDFVIGSDAKSTTENIEKFSKVFTDAVQKAVEDRLKGTTPSGGSGSGADTSKMSDEEYYKWRDSQKK